MGRLIDADDLIEKLKRASIFEKITNAEDKNVFAIIDDMPTAYDVEKVVAELESKKSIIQIVNIETNQLIKLISLDKAIDIVKAGGVE